jgi:hypothetical protein
LSVVRRVVMAGAVVAFLAAGALPPRAVPWAAVAGAFLVALVLVGSLVGRGRPGRRTPLNKVS